MVAELFVMPPCNSTSTEAKPPVKEEMVVDSPDADA
jgi:hypothetical protein